MDIKHNLSVNPLKPAYQPGLFKHGADRTPALGWIERSSGNREIGHGGEGFAYDNETPRHRVMLHDHRWPFAGCRLAEDGV